MLNKIKENVLLNAKNIIGWKTNRKLIVFAVDDYGNVRLASPEARMALDQQGYTISSRFDKYDTLETPDDLTSLFEVLNSVKDVNGKSAVFTPLALPMNIDFERIAESGFKEYYSEELPQTFNKLNGYQNTWNLWKEGIKNRIFLPEFHGREHLNLKLFNFLLKNRDPELMANLSQRSYTGISSKPFSEIGWAASFSFQEHNELKTLKEILKKGLEDFKRVFGFEASLYNAPAGADHRELHKVLSEEGVDFIESRLFVREHQGDGKYKILPYFTGKKNEHNQVHLVRNCVFEPTEDRGISWEDYVLKQIDVAFKWKRPAHVSSHRVNFCGYIDEKNRKKGLSSLKNLLKKIVKKHPDVEFISATELGRIINESRK